nr:O-antigen polysaccharide polymerase Wzy [Aquimarina agarivorans]
MKDKKLRKLLFFIFSLVTIFVAYQNSGVRYNFKLITLYVVLAEFSLYGVFLSIDNWSYSLNKTFHIFTYFFLGIAPILQFKSDICFFNSKALLEKTYFDLGLVLLVIQIAYLLGYRFLVRFFKKKEIVLSLKEKKKYPNGIFILISLLAFLIFLILIKFDLNVIFKRPKNHWQKANTNFGLLGYTLLLIIRLVPGLVLVLYNFYYGRTFSKTFFILIFILLISAFPLSLNRGDLLTIYLPVIILYIPIFTRKWVYSIVYFIGVFIIFPILNFFRVSSNTIDLGENLFLSPHLDAFHNFGHLYKEGIVTNGKQLLGSIFFFIQESNWDNRPVGTGQMIAEMKNFSYTNISMPFWGEGYANFGFFGVFIFLIVIIVFNASLDVNYHVKKCRNKIFIATYLFFLGMEFYLLRGDLFSSVKKISSFLLALVFIQLFFKLSQLKNRFINN